jgi:phosphoribosylanthranilate isomerase
MSLKLKVCGMRDPQNIEALTALAPDYMGFIFYEKSRRFVGGMDPALVQTLPASIKPTGVFVNEALDEVLHIARQYKLAALQLHGAESPEYCQLIKEQLTSIEVIKAFGVDDSFNFYLLNNYQGLVDYFLFDTQSTAHGGSGKTFDWAVLRQYQLNVPYFLSGGIGLDQVTQIKKIVDPRLYAVDVNSRFEIRPAFKNIDQLTTFKNQL